MQMSMKEIKMYEELLKLLEKRFDDGEIDKQSYVELKRRYSKKLEDAKKSFKRDENIPSISVAGVKSIERDSVSVAGSAKIYGGTLLREIRVSGSGKIMGDIECMGIKASGSLKCLGNVISHADIKCAGAFKCDGSLYADANATFSGSTRIEGEVVIEGVLTTPRSFKCEKSIQARQGVHLSGSSKIEGNILSENIVEINGKANIEGHIVGKDIKIGIGASVFEVLLFRKKERTHVEGSIVAHNEIDIQDVYVEGDVKGRIVRLGPNTKIEGTVFYVDDLLFSEKVSMERKPQKITVEELRL